MGNLSKSKRCFWMNPTITHQKSKSRGQGCGIEISYFSAVTLAGLADLAMLGGFGITS